MIRTGPPKVKNVIQDIPVPGCLKKKTRIKNKELKMKKIIVLAAVFCLAMFGISGKVFAGPTPVSAQEVSQLSQLDGNNALLMMKAGGTFPNVPEGLAATEESALKNLEKGSPDLAKQKAGDGPGEVLVWVVVICVCVVLLRIVNVL